MHEENTGWQLGQGLFSVQSIELMQLAFPKHACICERQLVQAHDSYALRAVMMQRSIGCPMKPLGGQYQNADAQALPHLFALNEQPHVPLLQV